VAEPILTVPSRSRCSPGSRAAWPPS
jgi:hypothetical protein